MNFYSHKYKPDQSLHICFRINATNVSLQTKVYFNYCLQILMYKPCQCLAIDSSINGTNSYLNTQV